MTKKLSLKDLNQLTVKQFHESFINVVECWPEAAIYVSALLPVQSIDALLQAFEKYLDQLPVESKLKILRLHPDLAGKLADEGGLTIESTFEQQAAGLDQLSAADKRKLTELNEQYKTKFSFPFVICARENKTASIMSGLASRLNNTTDDEIANGIAEVKKICNLRTCEIVEKQ